MDDLISRQDAIKVVKGIDSYFVKYIEQLPSAQPDGRYINADELIKRLKEAGHEEAAAMALKMAGHERKKNLPSAQPERKTGKWIYIRAEENGNGLYQCSVCSKGDIHAPEVEVPYCWNCGARISTVEGGWSMSRCDDCIHNSKTWEEEPCDSCTMGGDSNHFEPDMSAYMNAPEESDE